MNTHAYRKCLPSRSRHAAALLMTLTVALLMVGCSSTRSTRTQLDDAAITTSIKGKFAADPEINPFNIDVDTRDGRVRLSGTVDDRETRSEAVKHANNTKGVISVTNEIEIGNRTVGEGISDAAIGTKVKALLAADPQVNPFRIDVDVQDGVVTLSGELESKVAADEAKDLADSVKGVKRVVDRLVVVDPDVD